MICHQYNAVNYNSQDGKPVIAKVIKIGTINDIGIASRKLIALFGDNACFLKLEYAGTWTL